MQTMRYCFTLDLIDNQELIDDYKKYHKAVWPAILKGIKEVGITAMEIYLLDNRMFMIMDTLPTFVMQRDMDILGKLPRQKEWEKLMWKFQQALPQAQEGEKWMQMEQIFKL